MQVQETNDLNGGLKLELLRFVYCGSAFLGFTLDWVLLYEDVNGLILFGAYMDFLFDVAPCSTL